MMDITTQKEAVYMPAPHGGRQVKVMIKEVYKHTAACNACRTRKRKCDGKAPCSYCVAKKQPCEFSQQRKRGPPRRQVDENSVGFVASKDLGLPSNNISLENYLVDLVEAKSFIDYYWGYIKHRVPGETPQFILAPNSTSDKIQAYATLAFASRISGNAPKATVYIGQARALAGSIFDNPKPESVAALIMMSHYWQLVLNIPLAIFYYEIAVALSKLTPLQGKLAVFCKVGEILKSETIPRRQKSELVKMEIAKSRHCGDQTFGCPFVSAAADILAVFGYNVMFPEEQAVKKFFHIIDDLRISEEDRGLIADSINQLRLHCSMTAQTIGDILFYDMFCSLYMAITEWKSGHIKEALSLAKSCLTGIQQLSSFKQLGIASDYPHICMLSTLCKFFYEHGEHQAVYQLCQFIREVCKVMQPEFNFVITMIDEFMEYVKDSDPDAAYLSSSPSSSSPPSSPLSPSSPSSPLPVSSPSNDFSSPNATTQSPPSVPSPPYTSTLSSSLPSTSSPVPSTFPSSLPSSIPSSIPFLSSSIPPFYTSSVDHTLHPLHMDHSSFTPQTANSTSCFSENSDPQTTTFYTMPNDEGGQTTNFYTQNDISPPSSQSTNCCAQNNNCQNVEVPSFTFVDSILSSTDNSTFDGPLINL